MHSFKQHWKVNLKLIENSLCSAVHETFNWPRVSHSARVNVYGIPFIREMSKITGVSGSDLAIKCPVAGYPIEKIHWERGKSKKN